MDEAYIVYVKTTGEYITAVNSSGFLCDVSNWVEIDRGFGLRCHHAQGNYLPRPIQTESGVWRYKLLNGVPVECTAEEIAVQEAALPAPPMSDKERIAELEEALEMLLNGVTE